MRQTVRGLIPLKGPTYRSGNQRKHNQCCGSEDESVSEFLCAQHIANEVMNPRASHQCNGYCHCKSRCGHRLLNGESGEQNRQQEGGLGRRARIFLTRARVSHGRQSCHPNERDREQRHPSDRPTHRACQRGNHECPDARRRARWALSLPSFPLRTNEQPDSERSGELICERRDIRRDWNVHPLRMSARSAAVISYLVRIGSRVPELPLSFPRFFPARSNI